MRRLFIAIDPSHPRPNIHLRIQPSLPPLQIDPNPTANGKKEAGASEQGATVGVALRGGQICKAPGPRGHLDGAGADEDGEGENHEHGEGEQALHGAAEALFRGFHAAPGPELCASHSVTGWVIEILF